MEFYRTDGKIPFGYTYKESEIPEKISPHFHNYYEIMFFLKCDAYYMVEGNKYEIAEGDILFTNPRELHCPVFQSSKNYKRAILTFKQSYLSDFITEKYNPFNALDKRKLGTKNKIPSELVKKYEIDKKICAIAEYYESDKPEKELMIKTNLVQILICMNNLFMTELKPVKSGNIDFVIEYINKNLTSKITLEELGKKFHLNKYHISHAFKEKTGFSILEYVNNKRIIMAKELILEGIPLNIVAEKVGFNDYSNFYRSFKKTLGYSPKKLKS